MLSEKRVLRSIEILPESQCVNVLWVIQVLRESGEVIAETNHRKAYALEQQAEFLEEVDGAAAYLPALGW